MDTFFPERPKLCLYSTEWNVYGKCVILKRLSFSSFVSLSDNVDKMRQDDFSFTDISLRRFLRLEPMFCYGYQNGCKTNMLFIKVFPHIMFKKNSGECWRTFRSLRGMLSISAFLIDVFYSKSWPQTNFSIIFLKSDNILNYHSTTLTL